MALSSLAAERLWLRVCKVKSEDKAKYLGRSQFPILRAVPHVPKAPDPENYYKDKGVSFWSVFVGKLEAFSKKHKSGPDKLEEARVLQHNYQKINEVEGCPVDLLLDLTLPGVTGILKQARAALNGAIEVAKNKSSKDFKNSVREAFHKGGD